MPTYRLHPTPVEFNVPADNLVAPVMVGDPSVVWADESPSTYTVSSSRRDSTHTTAVTAQGMVQPLVLADGETVTDISIEIGWKLGWSPSTAVFSYEFGYSFELWNSLISSDAVLATYADTRPAPNGVDQDVTFTCSPDADAPNGWYLYNPVTNTVEEALSAATAVLSSGNAQFRAFPTFARVVGGQVDLTAYDATFIVETTAPPVLDIEGQVGPTRCVFYNGPRVR